MKHILFAFTSLALFTLPALAQSVGLPALQQQVASLQAQLNALTAGDGTAEAIVGTWKGDLNSLVIDRSVKQSSSTSGFTSAPFFHVMAGNSSVMQPFFYIQHMEAAQCGGTAIVDCFVPKETFAVGMNPDYWLVKGDRGPMTITLARQGMNLIGCSAASCPDSSAAMLRGVVVGNNFFLLKLVAPGTGPCGTGVFQGSAALSVDRTWMNFTGAGVDADCSHIVFSLNLRKS